MSQSNKLISLHANRNSEKLKADQKNFMCAWSKMGVVSLVMELENTRYLKNKQMEWSDFFHAGTNSEEP